MVVRIPKTLDYTAVNELLPSLSIDDSPRAEIDFSQLNFSYPLAMLMLAGALRKFAQQRGQRGYSTAVSGLSASIPAHTYLEHLGFFDFIHLPGHTKLGVAQGNSNYMPIRRIARADFHVKLGENKKLHDALIEEADVLALVLAGDHLQQHEVRRSLAYSIKEIVRNVFEHSGKSECYVAGQRWGDGRVEIVIMDEGVGILKTISESFAVGSDQQALEYAIKPGVSRLSGSPAALEASDNAGLGLFVLSEIGKRFGKFALGSGTAALRQEQHKGITLDATNFPGTFVGIHLNARPTNFRVVLDEIVEQGESNAAREGLPIKRSGSSKLS